MLCTFLFGMEKDFEYIELFELYKELLTEKQREIFSSHYLYDLSLSEIAEPDGFSRQSVYDAIKKVKSKLTEYETKLRLYEKFSALDSLAEEQSESVKARIKEIIGR